MIKAKIPKDEVARLKSLYEYEILDTDAEKVFDDLTQLASSICETPISLISLVDPNRQWFKSKYGLDVDETQRDIAFCSHAILQNQVFEIQNALLDERFCDNPLVTGGPNIRFYAGSPLVTPTGSTIGTLCVISDKPKKLSEHQLNALTVLGKEVIAQLELRLSNKKLTAALNAQKAHNQTLTALKNEADIANTLKGQFLANMSHELRTPLHGVLNLAEIALAETTLKEKDAALQSILKSATMLSNIVNDILDFSKIEAGKLDIECIHFNLHDVINNVINPLKTQANIQGIQLEVTIDENVETNLKGDPVRISQILNNLCSNAIKFTSQGYVNLNISAVNSALSTQRLQFEVVDTGMGISEAAQSNLFKEFQQADSSTSRKYGGTGLGLSICAKLSELMGGKISFSSVQGSGSTFTYQQKFELSKLRKELNKQHEVTDLHGCTILVAEDNKVNQIVITKLLSSHNANVIITENGKQCADYALAHPVDLIFMDIQMPVMDGVNATKLIRSQKAGKTIPIIAMTANTMEQDIQHYLRMGMDGYLTKPFNKIKLNSLLNVYNPNNQHLKNLAVQISNPDIASSVKLSHICNELKKLIPNANRVSLWLFNHDHNEINALICHDENSDISKGITLTEHDFPEYFSFILSNQVLDASDARHCETTKQFNKVYFEPCNIYSLLDYIFFINDKPLGIICCESVGKKVTWSHEDKQSLIKIADIATLFLSKQIRSH